MKCLRHCFVFGIAAIVLAACGKEEQTAAPKEQAQQRPALPEDLGWLVPEDAVGLITFAPLEQLQPKRLAHSCSTGGSGRGDGRPATPRMAQAYLCRAG